jgi:hypothetical protein
MKLVGANTSATVTGAEELAGKSNYFIGNDPKKWRTNVPNYAQVRYAGVYPGVDLVYYGNQGGQLEYDFVVAPGADPSAIVLDVGAVREPPTVAAVSDRRSAVGTPPLQKRAHRDAPLQIAADGDLVVKTDGGEVRFHKPLVYQEQSTVDSSQLTVQDEIRNSKLETRNSGTRHSSLVTRHSLDGHYTLDAQNQVRFQVAAYDHSKPLFIDPVLTYSTYLGGNSADYGYGIAADSSGNAYVTGFTISTNFPTVNPIQGTCPDCAYPGDYSDAFVTEFNPTGSALVYSTYLGGSKSDYGWAIAVDSSGNAYVTGTTYSTDFPTMNPLQPTNHANPINTEYCNTFVAKLNAGGSALVYSTYLGGSVIDYGYGIALDSSGDAYVAGYTTSPDFPTANPLQADLAGTGTSDAYVAELNPAGSALVYSTFLGGSSWDYATSIAVDSSGNAYVTGLTLSTDFPTVNPIQATNGGYYDAFISKLNAGGSALVYSTYLGGAYYDYGMGIAVDSSGNAYVAGWTESTNFPTMNPLQATNKANAAQYNQTAFVAKLNAAGSALDYSTYLGGSRFDVGEGIAVDSSGDAYVTGYTASINFPTANPIQASCDNCLSPNFYTDAFVAVLNPPGSALVYSTYLGGSNDDYGRGIAVDSSGNAYVTGITDSTNFPTVNPLQATLSGGIDDDVFVAKILPDVSLSPSGLTFAPQALNTTSAPQTVTVTNNGTANLTFSSISITGTNLSDFEVASPGTTCSTSSPVAASGGQCTVSVTFTPSETGGLSAALTLMDSASSSPQSVSLTGTGAAPVAGVSPPSLTFSNQSEGTTSASQPVILSNTGAVTLTIASIVPSTNFGETDNCAGSVAAGGSCTINVTFSPTTTGSLTGTLTITDNSNGVAGSTQMVGLSGTGTLPPPNLSLSIGEVIHVTDTEPPAASLLALQLPIAEVIHVTDTLPPGGSFLPIAEVIHVTDTEPPAASLLGMPLSIAEVIHVNDQVTIGPNVSLSPSSLTFPAEFVGATSSPLTVTLTNTGTVSLTILGIGTGGAFSQTNNCGKTVSGGANCAIAVTFKPKAAGTTTGLLLVGDNSATGALQGVALSGTGLVFTTGPHPPVVLPRPKLPVPGQPNAPVLPPEPPSLPAPGQPNAPVLPPQLPSLPVPAQPNAPVLPPQLPSLPVPGQPNAPVLPPQLPSLPVPAQPNAPVLPPQLPSLPAPGQPTHHASNSPQTVTLSGTGTTPLASVSSPSLTFSAQNVGTSSAQTVRLINTGKASLAISNITASGDFSQTNTCAGSAAAGSFCTINVAFKPTTTGSRTGTLTITDNNNGVAGSTQTVTLSGTGEPVVLRPSSIVPPPRPQSIPISLQPKP